MTENLKIVHILTALMQVKIPRLLGKIPKQTEVRETSQNPWHSKGGREGQRPLVSGLPRLVRWGNFC